MLIWGFIVLYTSILDLVSTLCCAVSIQALCSNVQEADSQQIWPGD